MSAGRRGIFDGVLEGLHQHWKHREVAKVITMQRLLSRVIYTAQFIERESGGILVSVDKLKEGHAIIIYRGKNYSRPKEKIAKNLLTKRKALQRSLEMQRIGVSHVFFFAFIILLYLYFSHFAFKTNLLTVFSVTEVFCSSEREDNL